MSRPRHQWGRSILGSVLAHLRAIEDGVVLARDIAGQRVGPAPCGVWLVDDIESPIDSPHIRMCGRCLAILVDGPQPVSTPD